MSQRKILHVMEYSGRQTYVEINEAAWKKLTENTAVVGNIASGWFVDRDLLSRMLFGLDEFLTIEVVGDWGRPNKVDYWVNFSNSDKPETIQPWENFK